MSVDVLIVGAGPVGLFGAYYAGVRGLSTAVLDSLPEPGGHITAMYPEKAIFDVGGFPAIRGRELVANLVAQAAPFSPGYLLGQQAVGLERGGDEGFVITTSTGARVRARSIIITGGIGTFTPRPLPTGEEMLGRGVVHFVPNPDEYSGLHVVVVGGGDSAVDWALLLEPIAKSVTLVHRRSAFRAHPHSVNVLKDSSVQLVTDAQVSAVVGDPVTGVEVTVGDEVRTHPCDRLVAALGFTANLGPLLEWGVEIQQRRHIVVDTTMCSSVPGVYASGDICEYEGKVRLIATGFGEVATAVNNAVKFMDPSASVFPGHLSDYAPPGALGSPGTPSTVHP
jgi:thioredoxin reductase (NADPH)